MTFNSKIILGTLLIAILFVACTKEQVPAGLILNQTISFTDTTYTISQTPAAQEKVIFFEEATGVHCLNCPAGAAALQALKVANPNRILSAAVYSKFLNEFQSPAKYNFNSQDAQDLVEFLGGDPSKPFAAIDRINNGSGYFYDRNDWSTMVADLLTKSTPLNIDLSVTSFTEYYNLNAKITFTENIKQDLAISIFLIEDSVKDLQYFPSSVIDTNYIHNHILRKIVTPLTGISFLQEASTKYKGMVLERRFTNIRIPNTIIDKKHCKLVCFVNKVGTSKEIIHVQEIDLP